MRPSLALFALAALVFAPPALAWEAQVGEVCEITHEGDSASVRVTYDLERLEYAIAITLPQAWPEGPVFAIRFDGPQGNVISTNRHVISNAGATLTVTDRGFGNVLNGLEFNTTATALLGDQAAVLALDGAAPAVQAFRACAESLSV
ncbi:MAG: hypothetical protein KI785_02425 [Devosiaceae bacterium]|nr:hypothetical protein [Devosiaceae bacterium MH13]